ncbi:replication initiation protein, partial [Staphylococcus pseudintermedius]|nr:replication initiation protein [Staphylococcus pseudintermedius]
QIFYRWNQKEYLASEIFELSEEEKKVINNQMIDELKEDE